jgi:hypothetical protein
VRDFAVAHLTARRVSPADNSDIEVTWVRRTRRWHNVLFQLPALDSNGATEWEVDVGGLACYVVTEPRFVLTDSMQSDLGLTPGDEIEFTVRQVNVPLQLKSNPTSYTIEAV